jgi:hypothetical protein
MRQKGGDANEKEAADKAATKAQSEQYLQVAE